MEKAEIMKAKGGNKGEIYRNVARYSMLILTSILFVFSLLSGTEVYDGGIKGFIGNSMNALPWFVLYILLFVAWKYELIGGILIVLFGLWALYFFNFQGPNFWWSTFFVSLLIPSFGLLFIISWYLRKHNTM